MDYLIVQLDETCLTAARFAISRNRESLTGDAMFSFGPELSVTDAVQRLAAGITGSPQIILCLAPVLFAQRLLELPLKERRKAREVLPGVLQGELAVPVEELQLDALPAGEGHCLAVWARTSDISAYLELFTRAGLEPQAISCAPLAWSYLPGVSGTCAVSDGTALTVLQAGRPVYMRGLNAGNCRDQVTATLSALELSGQVCPERLFLLGELEPGGETAAQVETLPAPPDQGLLFKNQQAFNRLAGLYAVAKAAAAGDLADMRRGELAWKSGEEKLRRKLMVTALLVLVAAVLLLVSKGLQYRAAQRDLASLNSSISSIYREIFPTRAKAVDELSEVKGEIRKLSGLEGEASFLDMLKLAADAKGTTINGLYEAEFEGRSIRLKGDARSAQAVNEFKAALGTVLAQVVLGEVKSRPDGSVTFTVSANSREARK